MAARRANPPFARTLLRHGFECPIFDAIGAADRGHRHYQDYLAHVFITNVKVRQELKTGAPVRTGFRTPGTALTGDGHELIEN